MPYTPVILGTALDLRLMHACRAASGAEADIHRRMSDDYGKNISALVLSVVVCALASHTTMRACIRPGSSLSLQACTEYRQ